MVKDLWGEDNISEQELAQLSGDGLKQCPACGRLYHDGRKTCDRCGAHVLPPLGDLELVHNDSRKISRG